MAGWFSEYPARAEGTRGLRDGDIRLGICQCNPLVAVGNCRACPRGDRGCVFSQCPETRAETGSPDNRPEMEIDFDPGRNGFCLTSSVPADNRNGNPKVPRSGAPCTERYGTPFRGAACPSLLGGRQPSGCIDR